MREYTRSQGYQKREISWYTTSSLLPVTAQRHVRSYVHMSTHVQNPQQDRKIARANIKINGAIRNFAVATAALVTSPFCFHKSALSCFTLNEIFDMLQQHGTLYCGWKNLGSHVQFEILKEQLFMQTRVHVQINALAPILPGMERSTIFKLSF